jgi:formate hydrogenlyase subunit 3/multisubunit Na+/H+ antiporter MnhD subunit
MGGLGAKMPLTAFAFLFCSFSVMGVPPFGGFFSKYLVFAGTFSGGQVAIGLVFLVGAFMTILYLFRLFTAIFAGEAKTQVSGEGSPGMVGSVVFLGIASLASGILANIPSAFLQSAVLGMLGGSR